MVDGLDLIDCEEDRTSEASLGFFLESRESGIHGTVADTRKLLRREMNV